MDKAQWISIHQFCLYYQAEPAFLEDLQSYGLIEIMIDNDERYVALDRIKDIEHFMRLHYEMEINIPGIDAIQHLLKQIKEMQDQVTALKNRLERHEE